MSFDQIVSKYSDPLPCDTCEYALEPIGNFRRTRNCFCKKYTDFENMKPNGVLFNNEPCEHHKVTARDGGPGSGNFGHSGRPGLVGGSKPGGGSQYRGGRADIGYFSSKKDWLNGLTGEKQREASKFLMPEHWKGIVEQKIRAKNLLEDLHKQGLLTSAELEQRVKEGDLEGVREGMPPEEAIARYGTEAFKEKLAYYAGEARNWGQYKDRLINTNLSEEEKKTINWILENIRDFNSNPAYVRETYCRLKLKALGIPTGDKPIPEEMLYKAGVKELSNVPSIKAKQEMNWYIPPKDRKYGEGRSTEHYMGQIVGDNNAWNNTNDKDSFRVLNQKFLDTLAYKPLKPSEIDTVRYALNDLEKAANYTLPQEDLDSLPDADKDTIRKAYEMFCSGEFGELNPYTMTELYRNISWSGLRKKAERELAQQVFIIRNKMVTGMEPIPQEKSEVYKRIQEEKEREKEEKKLAKQRAEEASKRFEEVKKEDDEIYKQGVDHGDPMHFYKKSDNLNKEHLKDVIDGCNPFYPESHKIGDKRYTWNCQRCVIAFVARLRGYDVEAKPRRFDQTKDPMHEGTGEAKIFRGATNDHVEGRTGDDQRKEVERLLTEWGDGSVGLVSVAWANKRSAHIFVAMNDGGVIKYIDPQNPNAKAEDYIKTGEIQPWYTKIIRADDKPFTDYVHLAVRPRGRKYGDNYLG